MCAEMLCFTYLTHCELNAMPLGGSRGKATVSESKTVLNSCYCGVTQLNTCFALKYPLITNTSPAHGEYLNEGLVTNGPPQRFPQMVLLIKFIHTHKKNLFKLLYHHFNEL